MSAPLSVQRFGNKLSGKANQAESLHVIFGEDRKTRVGNTRIPERIDERRRNQAIPWGLSEVRASADMVSNNLPLQNPRERRTKLSSKSKLPSSNRKTRRVVELSLPPSNFHNKYQHAKYIRKTTQIHGCRTS
jgi:hypothetical protein